MQNIEPDIDQEQLAKNQAALRFLENLQAEILTDEQKCQASREFEILQKIIKSEREDYIKLPKDIVQYFNSTPEIKNPSKFIASVVGQWICKRERLKQEQDNHSDDQTMLWALEHSDTAKEIYEALEASK